MSLKRVAVIGGGPAGLMAAETLRGQECAVTLFDGKPSVGRKFLLAGKGGLNLTHSEPMDAFLSRYGGARERLQPIIEAFGPEALRAWALKLGVETFVGTSRRVFPAEMKAAPLLRSWLHRLRASGVALRSRHRWLGWDEHGALRFEHPEGVLTETFDATVMALGGASWPQLGSDGSWTSLLAARGVPIAPLRPSNCGFEVQWSDHFRERNAGEPLKSIVIHWREASGEERRRQGECVVTETGLEGSLIYALSSELREEIDRNGHAEIWIDLAPGREQSRLESELAKPKGSRSTSNHLRARAGVEGVRAGLLREFASPEDFAEPSRLAEKIKRLPVRLERSRPLAEAISTAGGVSFEGLDERLMLTRLTGVFCAGEMLDWEAPTGGYLLTACFATGRAAGLGAAAYLTQCGNT